MSTTQSSSPFGQIIVHTMPEQTVSRRERSSSQALRRQPSMSQGQALEKLGRPSSTSTIRGSTATAASSRPATWKPCNS